MKTIDRGIEFRAEEANRVAVTAQWLLWREGAKVVGKSFLSSKEVAARYSAMSDDEKVAFTEYLENDGFPRKRPKAG